MFLDVNPWCKIDLESAFSKYDERTELINRGTVRILQDWAVRMQWIAGEREDLQCSTCQWPTLSDKVRWTMINADMKDWGRLVGESKLVPAVPRLGTIGDRQEWRRGLDWDEDSF